MLAAACRPRDERAVVLPPAACLGQLSQAGHCSLGTALGWAGWEGVESSPPQGALVGVSCPWGPAGREACQPCLLVLRKAEMLLHLANWIAKRQ